MAGQSVIIAAAGVRPSRLDSEWTREIVIIHGHLPPSHSPGGTVEQVGEGGRDTQPTDRTMSERGGRQSEISVQRN